MRKRKVGEILRINISVPLWLILTIAVVSLTVSYFCAAEYRDQIKFGTVLLGGAAAIYSAYYVGAALHLRIERDKQQASFEILGLLNRPEFVSVRNFLEKEVEGHESLSATELYQKVLDDQNLDNAVTIVLGILEDASIGVQHDFVDEGVLYKSLFDIVQRNFHGLRGYIEQLRADKNVPLFFSEIEKLANSWAAGKRLSDGRKLPQLTSP